MSIHTNTANLASHVHATPRLNDSNTNYRLRHLLAVYPWLKPETFRLRVSAGYYGINRNSRKFSFTFGDLVHIGIVNNMSFALRSFDKPQWFKVNEQTVKRYRKHQTSVVMAPVLFGSSMVTFYEAYDYNVLVLVVPEGLEQSVCNIIFTPTTLVNDIQLDTFGAIFGVYELRVKRVHDYVRARLTAIQINDT